METADKTLQVEGCADYIFCLRGIAEGAVERLSHALNRPLRWFEAIDDLVLNVMRPGIESALLVTTIDDMPRIVPAVAHAPTPTGFLVGSDVEGFDARIETLIGSTDRAGSPALDVAYQAVEDADRELQIAVCANGVVRLTGALTPDAALGLVGGEKRLLAISTHSDGYSMQMGQNIVCAALDGPARRGGVDALQCFASGHCGRLDRPVSDLAASDVLLPASRIHAEVLCNLSCYGLRMGPSSSAYQCLGSVLLRAGNVKHIITTWGPFQADSATFEVVVTSLVRGMRLGEVVHELNRQSLLSGNAAYVILLGDPAHALDPDRRAWKNMVEHTKDQIAGGVTFETLASYFTQRGAESENMGIETDDNSSGFISALYSEIRNRRAQDVDPNSGGEESGPVSLGHEEAIQPVDLIDLLISQACRIGSQLMHSWLPMTMFAPVELHRSACLHCGLPAVKQTRRFINVSFPDRAVWMCVDCGPFYDGPPSQPLPDVSNETDGLVVALPEARLEFARSALELWPRRWSTPLPTTIGDDGNSVRIALGEVDGARPQICLISVFCWGKGGLHVIRIPRRLKARDVLEQLPRFSGNEGRRLDMSGARSV